MNTDREAKIRATVTREGETEAFREIADDIGSVDERAQAAARSAEELISDLGNVNPSEWSALSGAVQDVAKAVDQIGKAKGLEQQEKAVSGLEAAVSGLGSVLSEAWTEGTEEAKRYEAVLEKINAVQKTAADPLVRGYERAAEAVLRFEAAAEKGTEEAASRGAEAAFQISRLADELRRAQAEGRDVGRIGDELQQLSGRADKATQSVVKLRIEKDRYNRTLEEGRHKVEGYGRGIASLDDILLNFRDRGNGALQVIGRIGLALGGSILVFQQAYRAGQQLAKGLDWVAQNFFGVRDASDKAAGAVNRWIGLTRLANAIAGEASDAGLNHAKILESQRKEFERLGIVEKFTDDLQANIRVLAAARKEGFELAKSIEAIANAYELLTDQQIAERARKMLSDVNELLHSGFGLDDVSESVKGQVQDLLSHLDRMPEELRVSVQQMAATLNILSNEHQKAAAAAEEHAKRAAAAAASAAAAEKRAAEDRRKSLQLIGDEFESLIRRLEKRPSGGDSAAAGELRALEEEKKKLQTQDVVDPEDLGRIDEINQRLSELRREMQEAGTAAEDWGVQSTSASEAVDDAIRGIIDRLGPQLSQLSTAQQAAIENILTRLQQLGETGQVTGQDVAAAFSQVIGVLQSAGGPVEGLRAQLDAMEGRGLDVGKAFDAVRTQVAGLGDDATSAGSAVQAAGSAIAEGTAAVEASGANLEKAGQQWSRFGEEAEKGSISIRRAGEEAEATSLAVERSGSELERAGAKMREAGEGAREAGQGAKEALPPFKEWVEEAGRVKTEIETSTISIKRHREETEEAGEAAKAVLPPFKEWVQEAGRLKTEIETSNISIKRHREETEKVSSSTGELAKETEQLATATESQAASTAQAAGSMQELAGASEGAASGQRGVASAASEAATAEREAAIEADALKSSLETIAEVKFQGLLSRLAEVRSSLLETAETAEQVAERINAALSVDVDPSGSAPPADGEPN